MNNAQSASIIKGLCEAKSISINSLLKECEIRKSLIYDMEKRDKTPSAEILEHIADYLNCSVDYLIGRVDTPDAIHSPSGDMENDDTDYIMTSSKSETMLLIEFRKLNKQGKEYILQTLDLVKDKYKKCNSLSNMEDIG